MCSERVTFPVPHKMKSNFSIFPYSSVLFSRYMPRARSQEMSHTAPEPSTMGLTMSVIKWPTPAWMVTLQLSLVSQKETGPTNQIAEVKLCSFDSFLLVMILNILHQLKFTQWWLFTQLENNHCLFEKSDHHVLSALLLKFAQSLKLFLSLREPSTKDHTILGHKLPTTV